MDYLNNIKNYGKSFVSEAQYFIKHKPFIHTKEDKHLILGNNNNPDNIFVLLHGLNSSPEQYNCHLEYLKSFDLEAHIYIPAIINKGFEEVSICCEHIMTWLLANISNLNNKRIFILGISNGGRIGMLLYKKLYELTNSETIYISTLGSPLYGTRAASIIKNYNLAWITNFKNRQNLLDTFVENNPELTNLVTDIVNTVPNFNQKARFYASTNDVMVFPPTCATIEGCDNIIVDGIGHDGLITEFHKNQIDWCLEKINK